jgi:hypothetical protein
VVLLLLVSYAYAMSEHVVVQGLLHEQLNTRSTMNLIDSFWLGPFSVTTLD